MQLTRRSFVAGAAAAAMWAALPLSSFAEEAKQLPEGVDADWSGSTLDMQVPHHRYADYAALIDALVEAYPQYCTKYSIGLTSEARDLWCLEITNAESAAEKTGITLFGNIHGGEMESAESCMYVGWWLLTNSDTERVQNILDNYIVYVIPMINPDGMEESFTYNVRYNMAARDLDGDGLVFSDPYTDVDGNGFIATVFKGESGIDVDSIKVRWTSASTDDGVELEYIGMESPDWNLDGRLGNDQRSSGVDLNRTFDYTFGMYDIRTYNPKQVTFTGYEEQDVIGVNAWSTNGQLDGPAHQPEVKAVQNFIATHPMNALISYHTGIQTILWPWCYRKTDYDNEPELAQMAVIGQQMAETAAATASSDGVTRNFYYRSSWSDYPTTSELIDYAYGVFGIHAYTMEVYSPGSSDPEIDSTSEDDGV